jgi:50S ribosomal subunit-associated GTPase HflX
VAARPYQAYSEAELLDLRTRVESSLQPVKREKRDYEKRAGPGFWNNEGYREIEDKEKRIWNEISAIDQELATRRRERGG